MRPAEVPPGYGAGPERGEPAGRSTFERRLREGADAFQFDTLINGPAAHEPIQVHSAAVPEDREAVMDARDPRDDRESQPPARTASDGRAIVHTGRAHASASAQVDEPLISPAPAAGRTPGRPAGAILMLTSVVASVAIIGAIAFRLGQWAVGRDTAASTVQAAAPGRQAARTAAPAPAADATTSRKGLPDPGLTPGDYAAGGDRAQRVPDAMRKAVLHAYHVPPGDTRYVVIRLIPLAFDGTNRPANLFPATPWFAGLKARLDKKLEELVQQGKMTTAQARQELTSDWIRAAHKHFVRNYGLSSQDAAHQEEESLHWY